jgi:integrase
VTADAAAVRADLLRRLSAGSDRTAAACREWERLRAFTIRHGIANDAAASSLYLTELLESTDTTVQALRYRLRLLDLAAVLHDLPRPSASPDAQLFLRGLSRTGTVRAERNREPIYPEMLGAMLDAISRDDLSQRRNVALLLIAAHTGLPKTALRLLRWEHVRLHADRATLHVPDRPGARGTAGAVVLHSRPGDCLCAVTALRDYRQRVGPAHGYLFGATQHVPPGLCTLDPVLRLLRTGPWRNDRLPASRPTILTALAQLRTDTASQTRDRSLLLLGFVACLTTSEAVSARLDHADIEPRGLVLTLPGRQHPAVVPRRAGRHCAVQALQAQLELRSATLQTDGDCAILWLQAKRSAQRWQPMAHRTPTEVVQHWANAAALQGEFTFTSLRIGFIRTAARAHSPETLVLQQAGLRQLASVAAHRQREELIRSSVAGRVGL